MTLYSSKKEFDDYHSSREPIGGKSNGCGWWIIIILFFIIVNIIYRYNG